MTYHAPFAPLRTCTMPLARVRVLLLNSKVVQNVHVISMQWPYYCARSWDAPLLFMRSVHHVV